MNTPVSPKITLFLMTEKGLRFLQGTAPQFRDMFDLVVVGADVAIEEDFEEEIIEQCNRYQLRHVKRAEFGGTVSTDYVMAISWRWLINHPSDRLIVFHDSLLPRYRGFAPLVTCLINGEHEIGVTAIFGASNFDTGDILEQSGTRVSYPLKIKDAILLINENYLSCGEAILARLHCGEPLVGTPQELGRESYSVWLDDLDYKIDWTEPAQRVQRFVDAVGHPYKGAYSLVDGVVIRITECEVVPDVLIENRQPGKVMFVEQGYPIVICGDGLLKITDAVIEDGDNKSLFLPVKRFRIRFT